MPSQQVEVLETIHALKRALRREKEATTDQPIASATNRGNKLKKGASYVHAGALPYPHGPDGYKQQIEHAGYTRYILDRNPRRYNEYGDELEDSESDAEADADAEDENPYSAVHLEELLCPLKHPLELATHPTLSIPFLDPALPEMVQTTEEKLRQERANLWRAKHLHRQMIGDESWMPCGAVETKDDWDLFEPRPGQLGERCKKRKRHEEPAPTQNGVDQLSLGVARAPEGEQQNQKAPQEDRAGNGADKDTTTTDAPAGPFTDTKDPPTGNAVDMQEAEPITNGVHIQKPGDQSDLALDEKGTHTDGDENTPHDNEGGQGDSVHTAPSPPRRITRALAAENNPSNSNVATPSPTISTISSLLEPDPLFLLPPHVHRPHPSIGLPIDEILETRRLLTMYIQKQEETIRCTEAVLGKLIKAKRLRSQVFEWCKAEGHVGEWSDGEDWIDAAAWGEREEDLRKGRDEDDVAAVGGNEGADEVGIQGGKKKRRTGRGRVGERE